MSAWKFLTVTLEDREFCQNFWNLGRDKYKPGSIALYLSQNSI